MDKNTYLKIANEVRKMADDLEKKENPELRAYQELLGKIRNKDGIKKLNYLANNPRVRKQINAWLTELDKLSAKDLPPVDFNDLWTKIKQILKLDLPVAKPLKMLLDYGVSKGFTALNKLLTQGQIKQKKDKLTK